MEFSENKRAEQLLGKRVVGPLRIIVDYPCEIGYHCPVCKYDLITDGNYDERLDRSEYNGFLRCSVCNFDYPSCLCLEDKKMATESFLNCIEDLLYKKERDA